ncbi:hypothetical protein D3C78_485950 [compost metagenome]
MHHEAVQLGAAAVGVVDDIAKARQLKALKTHDPAHRAGDADDLAAGDQGLVVFQGEQFGGGADEVERHFQLADQLEGRGRADALVEFDKRLEVALGFAPAAALRPLQVFTEQRLRTDQRRRGGEVIGRLRLERIGDCPRLATQLDQCFDIKRLCHRYIVHEPF